MSRVNSNSTIYELQTLRSIPPDVCDIIDSYSKYQPVCGKVRWSIPAPSGLFELAALRDNIAIVGRNGAAVNEENELHISKLSPSVLTKQLGGAPDQTEHPGQTKPSESFDCSFDPTPFYTFTNATKQFGNQRVVIDDDFIYTIEIWEKMNNFGKYDIHVFDHNGAAFGNFTIATVYCGYVRFEVFASSGYLWIAEGGRKLDQSNVRQFSPKGKLTSSYFFDFLYNTFCVDPEGKHLFLNDNPDNYSPDRIYKFKLDGKVHSHTEIMESIDTYVVGIVNSKRTIRMSADRCGGLIMKTTSNVKMPSFNQRIIRFSTTDNTVTIISEKPVLNAKISVCSNGNVVVWGLQNHIICYE